jgi:hypothetical protein
MAAEGSRTAGQHFVQPAADERQGAPDVPPTVHLWPPELVGQEIASQAPVGQVRSHAHASLQEMLAQAPVPEQLIVQVEPALQVTSLQAPSPVQLIVQFQSVGQATLPQSLALEHAIMHVCFASSHDVQSAGHCGTTQ